jgi:ketosteroid isomerase-like protein
MKSTLSLLSFVAFLFLITACNNTPCPETKTHEKEAVNHDQLIREVDELFEKTKTMMAAKDVEGLVNRFTTNGKLKLPVSPLIQGHDALRENYSATTELEDFKLDISTLEVEISEAGDMAYVVGEFNVSFNTPQGLVQDSGITLLTLVREDNNWKIAAEVLSSMPQNM